MSSPRSQTEYQIGRPTGSCAATGATLAPGEAYVGALVEVLDEDSGVASLERRDYEPGAWSSLEHKPRVFARWRGIVPESNAKPALALDPPALYDLLDQLGEGDDPTRATLRYVLALLLLRKRLLSHAGTRRDDDDGEVILLRRKGEPADAEPIEVSDPGLDPKALSEAATQLGAAIGLEA